MTETIIIIDVLSAVGLIALILLQQGKGADMGAAFGSGASQTLFGSRGTANFLTRTTAVLATVFFISNMALAYFSTRPSEVVSITSGSVMQEETPLSTPESVPIVPNMPQAPSLPEVPK